MRKSIKIPRRLSEKNVNSLRRQANISSKQANLIYYEEQLKVLNKYIDNYNAQMKTKDDYNILLIAANQELFSQTIATITPRHLFRDRGESRANVFCRFQDQARTEIKEIQEFLSRNNPQIDLEFKAYDISTNPWQANFESMLERKEKDHLETLKKWLPCQCGLNLLMKCLDILKKMLTQVQLTYKLKIPEGHGSKTPLNRSSYLNFNPMDYEDQKDQSDESMEFNKLSLFCSNLQYHIRAEISYCHMTLYSVFLTQSAKEVIYEKKKQQMQELEKHNEMHDLDSIKEEDKSDRPQNQLTRPSVERNQQFKTTIVQSKEQQQEDLEKQMARDKELVTKQLEQRLEFSLERLCGFFNTQSTQENITQVYFKNSESMMQDQSMSRIKLQKDNLDEGLMQDREYEEQNEMSQIQQLRPPCASINDLIKEMRCLVAFHFNDYAMSHFFPKKLLSKLQNIIFLTQYRLDHKHKVRRDAIGDQFTQKGNQLLADICEYYENSRSMHILETQSNCPCERKENEDPGLVHILSSDSLISRESFLTGNRFTSLEEEEPSLRITEQTVKSNLKNLDALLNEQIQLSRHGQQFKEIIGDFQHFTIDKAQAFFKAEYKEIEGEIEKDQEESSGLHFYHQLQNQVEHKLERKVTMRQIPDRQIDQRKLIFAGIFQIDRLTCDEENSKLIHPDKSHRWLFQKFFRQRIQHELLRKPNRQRPYGKSRIVEEKSKESIPFKKPEKSDIHEIDPQRDSRDMFCPPRSQYKLKEQLDQKMHDYRKMVSEIVPAGKQSGATQKRKEPRKVIKELRKDFEDDLNND